MEKVIKKNELLTNELADVKDQNAKVTQQNFKLSFILFSLRDTQFLNLVKFELFGLVT